MAAAAAAGMAEMVGMAGMVAVVAVVATEVQGAPGEAMVAPPGTRCRRQGCRFWVSSSGSRS